MRSACELGRRRAVRRRGVALLTFACYLLMTLGCAAGIVVGVWHGLLTLSLLGCALGVYYASELRVLMAWLRLPDPSCPPVQPAWHVLACSAGFALLAVGAAWTWGSP
jgi:hypothetical protein